MTNFSLNASEVLTYHPTLESGLSPVSEPLLIPVTQSPTEGGSSSNPSTPVTMCYPRASAIPSPSTFSRAVARQASPDIPSTPHIISAHRAVSADTPSLASSLSSASRTSGSYHPQYPLMTLNSTSMKYVLSVQLPTIIQPEMVTISANKGDKLKVIANAWHIQNECEYHRHVVRFPLMDRICCRSLRMANQLSATRCGHVGHTCQI